MVGSRTSRAKGKSSAGRGSKARPKPNPAARRKVASRHQESEPAISAAGRLVVQPPQPQLRSIRSWRGIAVATGAVGLALVVAACSRGGGSRDSTDFFGNRSRSSSVDPKYGTSPSPRVFAEGQRIPKGGGSYKLGVPYRVAGRWYVPQEDPGYDRSGTASWYGADFHGRKTANGEIFDMDALTAAHPTLPIPSYAYVTNLSNGRTILVRINDRGPYAHDRIMDLSRRTARLLGSEQSGLTQVRVRYAGRAPLDGDDRREREFAAQQPWFRTTVADWGRRMSAGAMVD